MSDGAPPLPATIDEGKNSNAHTYAHLPAGLREYLQQTPGLDVDLQAAPEAWQVVDHGRHLQAQGAIVTGYALCWLKTTLPRGEWLDGLTARRMSARTAQHMMAVFRFACRLAELDAVSALAELGAHKMLSFQDWGDEEIQSLAAGEEVRGLTYEQVAEASTRELIAHQRKWRQEHDLELAEKNKRLTELHYANERLEAEAQILRDQLSHRAERAKHPPWFTTVRVEGAAQCEAMSDAVDALESLLTQYLLGTAAPTDEDGEQYARMAAGTVYHALAAVLARGQVALRDLVARYGDDIAGGNDLWSHALDGDELQALVQRRAEVLRAGELNRAARQLERATGGGSRGRGRPKGSKDKAPRRRREG